MTSSWFTAAFHCFIVILIIHIKHLFTLFLNFYTQSTLNCMTSCHGATPTVNSRCTNPTRVHRSWLRVHELTTWMERAFTGRELVSWSLTSLFSTNMAISEMTPVVNSWTRVHDLKGTQHYVCIAASQLLMLHAVCYSPPRRVVGT